MNNFLKGEGMNLRQAYKLTKSILNTGYFPALLEIYIELSHLIYPLSLQMSV